MPVNKLCFVRRHIAHEQYDKSRPKIVSFTPSHDIPTNLQISVNQEIFTRVLVL